MSPDTGQQEGNESFEEKKDAANKLSDICKWYGKNSLNILDDATTLKRRRD